MTMESLFHTPLLVGTVCLNLLPTVFSNCTYPFLSDKHYALTQNRSSYDLGQKFDAYCKPQYEQHGDASMYCHPDGIWVPGPPSCNGLTSAPWWALMIGIVGGIIVISCCLPRVYFCLCGDIIKPEKERSQSPASIDSQEEYQK